MPKHRRLFAWILAVMLIAAWTSALIYLTLEADHECDGRDCSVCRQMELCEKTLKWTALAVLAAAFLHLRRRRQDQCSEGDEPLAGDTLVTWKIKLSC